MDSNMGLIACMHAKPLQSCLTLCNTMEFSLQSSSVYGIIQARILEWVVMPSSKGSSSSRDQTHVLCFLLWQVGSLPLAPPRKPLPIFESESESCSVTSDSLWPHGLYGPWNSPGQNTGVGRHSLLQGTFPTQGSNPGILYCRRTLYQLSHQGSFSCIVVNNWVDFLP